VDYLQRLSPSSDTRKASRYEQVSQISLDVDRIKKDFEIPVVTAAQLSRAVEMRSVKRPMLSDLRDSGTVEQDADVVVMLYKPSAYEDDAPDDQLEFSVEKNRHGSLFEATLYMDEGMWLNEKRRMVA
jgi:replicative DNA helicase